MTGITKFFKPTGTIGSAKKPGDAPASAARSPFAPLGNTEGIVRATIRPVNEADDDVVLMEQEVSAPEWGNFKPPQPTRAQAGFGALGCGNFVCRFYMLVVHIQVPTSSKRKREDLKNAAGAAGCSERAAPSTSVPRMQPLHVAKEIEAMTAAPAGEAQPAAGDADVEMSSQQQRAGAEEPSSHATGRCETLVDAPITCAVIAEAPASSAQPTVEPTPKRQRLPASADADNVCDADADADGTASTSTRQQHDRAHNHHNHSQHNQAASGSAAIAPQQQQTAGRAGSHTPAGATTGTGTDAQPSYSQQSVEGASGAAGGVIGGGAAGAAPGSAGGVAGGKDGAGCTGGGGKSGGAGPATLPEGLDLAEAAETLRGEAAELESALEVRSPSLQQQPRRSLTSGWQDWEHQLLTLQQVACHVCECITITRPVLITPPPSPHAGGDAAGFRSGGCRCCG